MKNAALRQEILCGVAELFREKGLEFTMDELAASLHRSKKTIYTVFPHRQALMHAMVDHAFDAVKEVERQAAEAPGSTVEKLRRVLGAMPQEYQAVGLQKLYMLEEKYPAVYAHVQERLETGWERTTALLEQGVREGALRPLSVPVFQTMYQASLEQFFKSGLLVQNGISYSKAQEEVVNILMDGIVTEKGAQ